LNGLFRIYKEEGLYDEINDIAVAANTVVFCLPGDTLYTYKFAKRTTKNIVDAVIITCNVSYFVPDAVGFKYRLKKLLLLSTTVATRAI
jgi:hypothetical protein